MMYSRYAIVAHSLYAHETFKNKGERNCNRGFDLLRKHNICM